MLYPILILTLASLLHAQSTPVDSILQGREYKLPTLDSSYRSQSSGTPNRKQAASSTKDAAFQLQFDAIADFDAAQARRADLQRRTGMSIHILFDSPFYKLRSNSYAKKEDAEDAARQLSDNNTQAFVVRVARDKE